LPGDHDDHAQARRRREISKLHTAGESKPS